MDAEETTRLLRLLAEVRASRRPFFLRPEEFEAILHWKLRDQYARGERLRASITADVLAAVTQAAFAIRLSDKDVELPIRVGILTSLPGVGVPVASAVLALVDPETYAVIDFRSWRQLFPSRRADFSVPGYQRYMGAVRRLATELGWSPHEVDLAVWEFDRQTRGYSASS